MEIEVNGEKLWLDFDAYEREKRFMRKKEEELWEYHFSGQRTLDLFGQEGAKAVLARQDREDNRHMYNHRSRGRKTIL